MGKKIISVQGMLSYARFVDRPNRFLVNIKIDGTDKIQAAFLHDPGRMKELLLPNVRLLVRKPLKKGNRKTNWDVLAVYHNNFWVTIKSSLPNLVAKTALSNGWISELKEYPKLKPEIKYGHSRLDFLLTNDLNECYVEVKGVTLVENGMALFPDAPTSRGTRHLQELIKIKAQGKRSVVLFICMRDDPTIFSPNWITDPVFSKQLETAVKKGVEVLVYKVKPTIENNKLLLYFTDSIKTKIIEENKTSQ
ncbi:MAG: DNA/RNA nuclease SfsA [Candidatus Heimdallarchaeota archaeon]